MVEDKQPLSMSVRVAYAMVRRTWSGCGTTDEDSGRTTGRMVVLSAFVFWVGWDAEDAPLVVRWVWFLP